VFMGSGEPFSNHILSTLILEKVRKKIIWEKFQNTKRCGVLMKVDSICTCLQMYVLMILLIYKSIACWIFVLHTLNH